jgi:hypothetical protein
MRRWMTAPTVIKDLNEMKIKEFVNGNFEWKLDLASTPETRTWTKDAFYWLPLARSEINKSENLQQTPGYE